MKAVLQSIKPKYCELIAGGKKTMEICKTHPKIGVPFKVYMYCTKGGKFLIKDDIGTTIDYIAKNGGKVIDDIGTTIDYIAQNGGKVIGEYICDGITTALSHLGELDYPSLFLEKIVKQTCLSADEIKKYSNGKTVCSWHISDLKIYDEPKELDEFTPYCEYNIDGECFSKSENVGCDCTEPDLNPDGTVNIYLCTRRLKHPPQSWCYVEELEE